MRLTRISLTFVLAALPLAASAQTVALAPQPSTVPACTLTMNFVPAALPARGLDVEPVIYVDSTQSYPIRSFSVKRTATAARSASVATVTADIDLESTVATLLDEHAVIERAELACASRNATLTNATIGYIGTFGTRPQLSFTMNFWPKDLETQR